MKKVPKVKRFASLPRQDIHGTSPELSLKNQVKANNFSALKALQKVARAEGEG